VFPQVPVRQGVLSLPKRLRYFLHPDPVLIGPVWRIVLQAVEERLNASSPRKTRAKPDQNWFAKPCKTGTDLFIQMV
jgi:hypothetical protein